jgi:beta-N-acetylhexosaminidase
MPADARAAIDAVEAAVQSGRVSEERLDLSVRRVLEAKYKLGLFKQRTVDLDRLGLVVGNRAHQEIAQDVSRRALVLVRDSLGFLDALRRNPQSVGVVLYADSYSQPMGTTLLSELGRRGYRVKSFRLSAASGPASYDSAAAMLRASPTAVFATSVRVAAWRGAIALPDSLAALIQRSSAERPTGLVSFGTPYLLAQVPGVTMYLLAWTSNPFTEAAVSSALTGGPITGRLPIDLPPRYEAGWGIQKHP